MGDLGILNAQAVKPTLEQEIEQLVKQFFQHVNYVGGTRRLAAEFTKQLKAEHRQLQAYFIQTVQEVLYQYGKTPMIDTDARNQFAVQWAKRVSEVE